MFKYAITLIVFGAALFGVGYVTYAVAPEGANAKTALFITGGLGGLAVVCAFMSLAMVASRPVGMIGVHLGLLIPLLSLGGPAARLSGSLSGAQEANTSIAAFKSAAEDATAGALTKSDDGVWTATFGLDDQVQLTGLLEPKGYQTVGIASTAILSLFGFVALLLHRPKVPPKKASKSES
ncbi:MAG: hypothetical protein Tsb0013_21960 [Phycisphaerales bacterium]